MELYEVRSPVSIVLESAGYGMFEALTSNALLSESRLLQQEVVLLLQPRHFLPNLLDLILQHQVISRCT